MDKNNIVSIISTIAFFVTLLLNLFLLTVRSNNKLSNRLLAFCFLVNAINTSIYFARPFFNEHPNLAMFRDNLIYLGAPLLYLYTVSVCYSDFRLRPKHLLHAVLFIAAVLIVTPGYYMKDLTGKILFMSTYSGSDQFFLLIVLGSLQAVGYSVAMFILLSRYKKIFVQNSANTARYSYAWLFQLALITAIAHGFGVIKTVMVLAGYTTNFIVINIIVMLTFLGILCWIVLKAMYSPDLFRGINSKLALVEEIVQEPKSIPQQINDEQQKEPATEMREQVALLRNYMLEEEPYLEPSLTIQDLANQMKMQVRDLSVLINHHLGQHFFDLVNEYRIQKAMQILKDPLKRDLNIQEIFYEVGFNSKSSFNTAFKKHTNQTPTQYRNS